MIRSWKKKKERKGDILRKKRKRKEKNKELRNIIDIRNEGGKKKYFFKREIA